MRLLVFALFAVLLTSSARAQPVATRDPSLQLQPPDPELLRAQRRQRLWMAAGIGMAVSSAAHFAVLTSDSCNNNSHASISAAGVFGAVGVAFAIGGGVRLAHSQRHYPATRGQKTGATFLALGTALAVQALLMPLWFVQGAGGCSS